MPNVAHLYKRMDLPLVSHLAIEVFIMQNLFCQSSGGHSVRQLHSFICAFGAIKFDRCMFSTFWCATLWPPSCSRSQRPPPPHQGGGLPEDEFTLDAFWLKTPCCARLRVGHSLVKLSVCPGKILTAFVVDSLCFASFSWLSWLTCCHRSSITVECQRVMVVDPVTLHATTVGR